MHFNHSIILCLGISLLSLSFSAEGNQNQPQQNPQQQPQQGGAPRARRPGIHLDPNEAQNLREQLAIAAQGGAGAPPPQVAPPPPNPNG